ncbi:hypothetical protein NKH77_28985 [Streptomyces sp. M19]
MATGRDLTGEGIRRVTVSRMRLYESGPGSRRGSPSPTRRGAPPRTWWRPWAATRPC